MESGTNTKVICKSKLKRNSMGQFYLITYSDSIENVQILKDRIRQFGDYINFLDNNWLIYTQDGVQDIYRKVSNGIFENDLILVMAINENVYWGRLNKAVWEWLKKKR